MTQKKFSGQFFFGMMIFMVLILATLSGCATLYTQQKQSPPVQQTIAVPEVQYVEITLIEGKTTKKEVLDALGMPTSIIMDTMSYIYSGDVKAKIHLVYKDGTKYNVILGYGEKYKTIMINFVGYYDDNGHHIPSEKNTGFSLM